MTDTTTAAAAAPFGRQLGETARAARMLLRDVLAQHATTFEEWVVLNIIVTIGPQLSRDALLYELAEGLETDTSEVSELVAGLERAGLIQASTSPESPTMTRIALTGQGTARHQVLRAAVQRTTDQVVANLDPDDLRTAVRVLSQINERVHTLRAG